MTATGWTAEHVLPEVVWDGLALNDERGDGTTLIVEDFEGWYGTPETDAKDAERTLVDGAVLGPKVTKPREMTLHGVLVAGTRDSLVDVHDQLAMRAVAKVPATMIVSDPRLGIRLLAEVRSHGQFTQTWLGPMAFRYTIPLRAVDPRKYGESLNSVTLRPGYIGASGREYPRHYRDGANALTVTGRRLSNGRIVRASAVPNGRWNYGAYQVPNRATLTNRGSADAPVFATYRGPLGQSRLSDGQSYIVMAPLADGVTIYVDTETLATTAPGGYSRASFLLAGSSAMAVPARGARPWSLYVATGTGSVTLEWRDSWA
jgi:hypothetical protein